MEEGQVIPADARLICDYENPESFAEYQEMHLEEEDVSTEKPEAEAEAEHDDMDEDEPQHHGVAIVACDQSAITGESLAVDKFMVRSCKLLWRPHSYIYRAMFFTIPYEPPFLQSRTTHLILNSDWMQTWESICCGHGFCSFIIRWPYRESSARSKGSRSLQSNYELHR